MNLSLRLSDGDLICGCSVCPLHSFPNSSVLFFSAKRSKADPPSTKDVVPDEKEKSAPPTSSSLTSAPTVVDESAKDQPADSGDKKSDRTEKGKGQMIRFALSYDGDSGSV